MIIRAVVYGVDEDGYRAEVPSLPGCLAHGQTVEDLHTNLQQAIHDSLLTQNERYGASKGACEVVRIALCPPAPGKSSYAYYVSAEGELRS